ncbi:MAG TPA: MarR family winged helix-turn-helix transcriptional regulator [Candidatus Paceibacterota bacterium]|nr:MarR family winged helix-turn-helix transcriptional regulator [Candidatus Paceibacterota bacterium]
MKERADEIIEIMEKIHRILGHKKVLPEAANSVTLLQFGALMFVHSNPRSPVQALGKHMGLSSSATAQLTERLVHAGLIERAEDPADRRSTLLSLTKKGKTVSGHMAKKREAHLKKIFEHIPERDLQELMRIYSTLLARLS